MRVSIEEFLMSSKCTPGLPIAIIKNWRNSDCILNFWSTKESLTFFFKREVTRKFKTFESKGKHLMEQRLLFKTTLSCSTVYNHSSVRYTALSSTKLICEIRNREMSKGKPTFTWIENEASSSYIGIQGERAGSRLPPNFPKPKFRTGIWKKWGSHLSLKESGIILITQKSPQFARIL